ncbi:hypothetical protein AgCh_031469 [Apium graveolens]
MANLSVMFRRPISGIGLYSVGMNEMRVTEPHHSYTPTAAKVPGTVSKERPRHQELSFDARRRSSPFLGLGAPGFTFINKLLKESFYPTCKNPSNQPLP